jgi:hypothetical protein
MCVCSVVAWYSYSRGDRHRDRESSKLSSRRHRSISRSRERSRSPKRARTTGSPAPLGGAAAERRRAVSPQSGAAGTTSAEDAAQRRCVGGYNVDLLSKKRGRAWIHCLYGTSLPHVCKVETFKQYLPNASFTGVMTRLQTWMQRLNGGGRGWRSGEQRGQQQRWVSVTAMLKCLRVRGPIFNAVEL